jgi:Holliday junction resolvase RusA-like endonuclease
MSLTNGDDVQILIIRGRLPGMNEIIELAKRHYAKYMAMKRDNTNMVAWQCKAQKIRPMGRVDIIFTHYRKDKREDKDNISGGAQKIVFDGLQCARVINNDGWSEIGDFTHRFFIDPNERIEIELKEVMQ